MLCSSGQDSGHGSFKGWADARLKIHTVPCRSEPARDSGRSVDINGECQSVIASRLTPTGICGGFKDRVSSPFSDVRLARTCAVRRRCTRRLDG
ncbi:hypothetical protein FHG55_25530 [Pseudomonas jessenii]|uniref:Uncharacterized protein n=1 Tax=Pseudomonas jessenii TaxID=77298 RepID=A0A5C4KRN3_PSEJE|nr:hypothetical protein FHG55_25530 [Pseudomonas jessenii]